MKLIDLQEGRDAPLYHFGDEEKARSVFNNDVLPATFTHDLSGMGKSVVKGSSLTRNGKLEIWSKDYKFTIDQSIITHTNKIIPLDGEYAHMAGDSDPANFAHVSSSRNRGSDTFPTGFSSNKIGNAAWDEEFVIGDVHQFHKAVIMVEVVVSNNGDRNIAEFVTITNMIGNGGFKWATKFNIPVYEFPYNSGKQLTDNRKELVYRSEELRWWLGDDEVANWGYTYETD